jgi:outer membrane biosynthesis protein TonB
MGTISNKAAKTELRIGLVMGGQLVEERRFRSKRVSIGESSKNTLIAPGCGVSSVELFVPTSSGYNLVANSAVVSKVRRGDTVLTSNMLLRGDRGRLVIGDVTVLFQLVPFVETAPVRLPHGLQPSLIDRVDRRVAFVVAVSMLAHGAIATLALTGDVEAAPSLLPTDNQQFTLQTVDVIEPEPVVATKDPVTNKDPSLTKSNEPAPVTKPHRAPEPRTDPAPANGSKDADPSKLRDQAIAMANMLTGTNGNGDTHDLPKRTVGADLNGQIDAARNKHVSIGNDDTGTRDDGALRPGSGKDPVLDGDVTKTTSITKVDTGPTPRITTKLTEEPPGVGEDLGGRIASVYKDGLVRCYRSFMATAGEAQGRVTLSFTMSASGRVVASHAKGFAESLDRCIEGRMSQWHFKMAPDFDGGDATVSLQLLPGM